MTTTTRFRKALAVLAILTIGLVTQQGDVGAATLRARVAVHINATLTQTLDLVTADAPLVQQPFLDLTNGTGANQANVVWSDDRSLATGTTEDIDLVGGGLTDAFGATVAPARLRTVLIVSSASNTTNLTLFGDANSVPLLNTAATTVTLKPGGFYLYTDPSTAGTVVTAGTGDIIQVANAAGATATYRIVILGASS